MVNALRERAPDPEFASALVLGGGATATSALAALQKLQVSDISVAVRSTARSGDLLAAAQRLGVKPRLVGWEEPSRADLVISTVPAGAADAIAERLSSGSASGVIFDVIYNPWPTRLAQCAADAGNIVIGGLDLLLHQAALQVELMTGHPAPLDAMRTALSR
jgi:shikimate dehydrogenase